VSDSPTPPCLTIPLAKGMDRSSFSCGDASFDAYLQNQSGQDVSRNIAAVYVALRPTTATPGELARIRGYYTLSSHGIVLDELPEDIRRRLPRYEQAPAVLLGRLAVDQADQGSGLGGRLVFDAIRRVVEASARIAAWAIVVDARTPALVPWYAERFGFTAVIGRPTRLFLPVKQAKTLLASK
jgi:GNAT superfamily N-acetyltransferase